MFGRAMAWLGGASKELIEVFWMNFRSLIKHFEISYTLCAVKELMSNNRNRASYISVACESEYRFDSTSLTS